MGLASMDSESLCFLPLHQLSPMLRDRQISPVEVLDAVLSRIRRHNPALNAFLTVTEDNARAEARQAEIEIGHGQYRGPLHGVPVSLKDLYATRGVRTTAGSRILAEWVPDFDAAAVERLRDAGAIFLGKATMHEFALGSTSINPHFGPVRNPWDTSRIPAGSSGGSAAAVATGLSYLSMGSETGNSIRRPAAFCGVVGLKPTYGRVSRFGMVPAAWSLDHAGPFTRAVRDAAIALDVLTGPDRRDPASIASAPPVADSLDLPVDGLRVGVPTRYLTRGVAPVVAAAFERALDVLRHLKVTVVEIDVPAIRFTAVVSSTIMLAEAAAYHAPWLASRASEYGADVRARLDLGSAITASEYLRAQRGRALIADDMDRALETVDLIAAPTASDAPTPIADGAEALGDIPYTVEEHYYHFLRLPSLVGLPVVSVPMGFAPPGLPLGLQIIGRRREDDLALRLAHAYEQAAGWVGRQPPLD
jgi:aspartyl-tRNA(Asn)/glutamyl-tRNA(Gln) amidotransferase subunit A